MNNNCEHWSQYGTHCLDHDSPRVAMCEKVADEVAGMFQNFYPPTIHAPHARCDYCYAKGVDVGHAAGVRECLAIVEQHIEEPSLAVDTGNMWRRSQSLKIADAIRAREETR
jgi:hypothetical protein